MSRPRPVDPARSRRPAGARAGPLVGHHEPDGAVDRVEPHREAGRLGRVREDVVDEHVDQVGQVVRGHAAPAAARRAAERRPAGPGPRRARARSATRSRTTTVASQASREVGADRSARLAHDRVDAALEHADVVAGAAAPSSASDTASASRRSAVTGVRSRCERSATAGRSATSSSLVRSARPLSARASSSVSSVPRTSARADRSPSRSWWATSATSSSGSLIRRPEPVRDGGRQRQQQDAEPDDAEPGRSDARGAVLGRRWCAPRPCPRR